MSKSTAKQRQAHREQTTAAALETLHTGLEALTSSETWKAMLRTAASFHTYSPNNYLLIWAESLGRETAPQMPVASFNRWKKLGRNVRKGEKAYRVWAPIRKKERDEETGEETERVVTFKLVPVFTYDQTEGEPIELPQPPKLPEGNDEYGAWDALERLVLADPAWTITREQSRDGENGWTDFDSQTINVSADLDLAAAAKTLAHELAHRRLHASLGRSYRRQDVRSRAEVEAESTAYVVMNALGLDVAEYSLDYVAGWAEGDLDAVKETVTTVLTTARSILADLEDGAQAA